MNSLRLDPMRNEVSLLNRDRLASALKMHRAQSANKFPLIRNPMSKQSLVNRTPNPNKTVEKTKSRNSPRLFPHLKKKNLTIHSPRDKNVSKESSQQRQTVQSQFNSNLQSRCVISTKNRTGDNILEESALNTVSGTVSRTGKTNPKTDDSK